jgi:hypothetical protein
MVDDNTNVGILVTLGPSRNSLDADDEDDSTRNTLLNLNVGVRCAATPNRWARSGPTS